MKHALLTVALVFFLAACELVDETPVSHESPTVTDQSDASQPTSELASKKGRGGADYEIHIVRHGLDVGDEDWKDRASGPGDALVSNPLCAGESHLNTKQVKAKEYNGGWNWDQIPCRFLEGNSPFDYRTNLFDEPPGTAIGQVLVYAHGVTHNTIDAQQHIKFWLWGKECEVNTLDHCDPIGDHTDQTVWVTEDLMFESFEPIAPSSDCKVGECTVFRVHLDQTVESMCGGRKKNRSCVGPVHFGDLIFTRVDN